MSGADGRMRAILAAAPVLPVLAPGARDDTLAVARALHAGGMNALELTLRSETAMATLAALARELPRVAVGAGTVTTPEAMRAAIANGASFLVSPGASERLYESAAEHSVPWLPAVATASELMRGMERGFDTFKFFPAQASGGTGILRAWQGPFASVRFCATGGIDAESAAAYLALPNVLSVGGSWLVPAEALANRDWAAIERLARAACSLRSAAV